MAEVIPGEKVAHRRPGMDPRLGRDHGGDAGGTGDNRAVGDRRRNVWWHGRRIQSSRCVRGTEDAGDGESRDRRRRSWEVGSVVRTRVVVVGERRDRRDGRQRARPLGDRRRLLGEQGMERQHCRDAVSDRVGKRGMIQRRGTITVDGVAAGFDKPLHQHGQLLLNLSKNLGRTTAKPCVWKRRRPVDQLSRVALDHPAVNVFKNNARLPVGPLEVTWGHTVEEIRRRLHVEVVAEGVCVHDDVNEPGSAGLQIQISNEPQQPRALVGLGHGDRGLGSVRYVHRRCQCSSESVAHGHSDRAVGRRVGGAQDGQVVVLTGSAGSDRKLGRSEALVAQRDPVTEKGRFTRVLSVRSHHAKVSAAFGDRPVDHFAVIVEDKIESGDNVQGTGCRAKAWQVICEPPNLNELVRDGTDQHPAVKDFAERHGIAAGCLGVSDAG